MSAGGLPVPRDELAISDLVDLPLRRLPHRALLARCWELRDKLAAHDAAYVAAAEALGATLLTADLRLFRVLGLPCSVETLTRLG